MFFKSVGVEESNEAEVIAIWSPLVVFKLLSSEVHRRKRLGLSVDVGLTSFLMAMEVPISFQ